MTSSCTKNTQNVILTIYSLHIFYEKSTHFASNNFTKLTLGYILNSRFPYISLLISCSICISCRPSRSSFPHPYIYLIFTETRKLMSSSYSLTRKYRLCISRIVSDNVSQSWVVYGSLRIIWHVRNKVFRVAHRATAYITKSQNV